MFGFLKKLFGSAQDRAVKRFRSVAQKINQIEEGLQSLSDEQLQAKTAEFKERVEKGESLDDLLPEAYAVVKNACRRLCGKEVHVFGYDQYWDMVPYDVQLIGAIALFNGTIAEMQTGEGKTLTAVMPLYLRALSGKPVHLVTVNDYLAQRDCQWVGMVLRFLGLTTGALTGSVPLEERRAVYACDVVYGTASEFGFDYLRDNSMAMRASDQVQRGHYFSIVDEIDSILIDEARTPLIISGPVPVSRQMYDELKAGVLTVVRLQRDFCNRLASEARKVLETHGAFEEAGMQKKRSREEEGQVSEAFRKLWLVSKGTPRNKILKRVKEDPDMRAAIDKWDLHYYSDQNKDEKLEALAELFIMVDEKASEYELTDKGIAAWNQGHGEDAADDFVMMDLGHEYHEIDQDTSLSDEEKMQRKLAIQDEDAKRKERVHNLRQLFRAHLLMERDVDYIMQEEKIVIIDENTGRPQPGRRFSDGLHQAIEAKEGVKVQKETQTYATITLQNFFRLYDFLAGMTGTAVTEANEFRDIYKLEVLEIPTHKVCQRQDVNDEMYMTEREKYTAILNEVETVHSQGRPILIGSDTVEVSEKLSRIFRQKKLAHNVLNAKNNTGEAEIIAAAGQKDAITISTNMAGRGTDIKLGEGVADLGGLHVIGTTRHHARRIDRQLRGRSGRQGDPGSSKFYISFEDSLMRLFSSPSLNSMLQRFRPPEGEPISAGILNRSIETAQKRVEQRNFMIRKHTLEYDDVMNKQRQEIYSFRNEILHSESIEEVACDLIDQLCGTEAEEFFSARNEAGEWDAEAFRQWLISHFPVLFEEGCFDSVELQLEDIERMASDKVVQAFRAKYAQEATKDFLPTEGEETGYDVVANAVRSLMIRKIDKFWQEHLLVMDHLRSDVHLRTVGQRDPLMEFKQEAFILFDELSRSLRKEIAQDLFRFQITPFNPDEIKALLAEMRMETERSLVADMEKPQPEEAVPTPVSAEPRIGRNDVCPCGSGKKYKKCCGAKVSNEL